MKEEGKRRERKLKKRVAVAARKLCSRRGTVTSRTSLKVERSRT